jgi:flagellin
LAKAGDVVLNNGLKKATMIIAEKSASTPPAPKTVNIDLTSAASINQSVADINTTLASAGYTAAEITGTSIVIQARVSTTPGNEGVLEFFGSSTSMGISFEADKINTVANATIDANGHVTFKDNTTSAVLTFIDSAGAVKTETIDPANIDKFIADQVKATGTTVNGIKAEIVAVDDGNGGTTGVLKLTQVAGSTAYDLATLTSDRTPNQLPIASASDSASSEAAVGTAPRTSVGTASEARTTIVAIDAAIQTVNIQRSNLGAVSNRLSHTVNNLTNISSNLSAAQGGIEDADFAHETTMLAKNQILQQASTAMLAQANASKQNVLSLLQG